jgi:Zn-dependent protease with chaperone function
MATHAQAEISLPRLNPFAFPSDTTFRFVLLIVFVTVTTVYIYTGLAFAFPSEFKQAEERITECVVEAYRKLEPRDLDPFMEALSGCLQPLVPSLTRWTVGGIAIVLALATVIYWIYPVWKIRIGKLVPLGAEDAPDVVSELAVLCREAGLARHPTFVWNPLTGPVGSLAFGRIGRYYVALSGGLVVLFYIDRPAFRAIVLHELAHLANRDVNKTYLAVAIWWAFLLAALFPYVVSLSWRENLDWGSIVSVTWRALALSLLVFLTRNAILRVREIYADVRASAWEGGKGKLALVIETQRPFKGGRWTEIWRLHPDPTLRRRILDDTFPLFRLGFWEALATGVAMMLALWPLMALIAMFVISAGQSGQDMNLVFAAVALFGAPLLSGSLAVGVLGVGLWRGHFAAFMRGKTEQSLGRMSVAFASGMIIGLVISFVPGLGAFDPGLGLAQGQSTMHVGGILAFGLLATVVLAAGLFLYFKWIAAGVQTWLEVAMQARSPRPAYITSLTLSIAVLTLAIGSFVVVTIIFLLSLPKLTGSEDASAIGEFLAWGLLGVAYYTLPVLIALWALPLAPWFWRRRIASATVSNWAFLEAPSTPVPLPRQAPLRPDLALMIGLGGGIMFCGLLAAGVTLPHYWVNTLIDTDSESLAKFYGQIGTAVCMQAAIAAIVVLCVKRLATIHALFAAFVAGSIITLGLAAFLLSQGGEAVLSSLPLMFFQIVYGGALLALPVSFAVSVIARPFRGFAPHL